MRRDGFHYYGRVMFQSTHVLMFDWGGTLVKVARQEQARVACLDATVAFLRRAGLRCPAGIRDDLRAHFRAAMEDPERLRSQREFDTHAHFRNWAEAARLSLPDGRFLDELVDAAWRPWIGCLDLLPGVGRALHDLKQAGYVLGLVSNCAAPPDICRVELERLGLIEFFAFTVFSSEVGYCKPHVSMYETPFAQAVRHACDLTAERVLFIGDTPIADIDGPHEQGFKTALVRTGNWTGDTGALAHEPDIILDSVTDLPRLLLHT